VEASVKTKTSLDHLSFLPKYAQYLLQERLDDFSHFHLAVAEEMHIPLMQFFSHMNYEERVQMARERTKEFLTYLAKNEAKLLNSGTKTNYHSYQRRILLRKISHRSPTSERNH
jgi:hypothetical protein